MATGARWLAFDSEETKNTISDSIIGRHSRYFVVHSKIIAKSDQCRSFAEIENTREER